MFSVSVKFRFSSSDFRFPVFGSGLGLDSDYRSGCLNSGLGFLLRFSAAVLVLLVLENSGNASPLIARTSNLTIRLLIFSFHFSISEN